MDEKRDISETPDADPDRTDRDPPSSTDPLVRRLVELQNEIDVVAPSDQVKGREALQRFREALERIAALEEMLAKAREREHELTTEAVRDRARLFEADAHIAELRSVASRVTSAEEARRDAEAIAQENQHEVALARGEAKAAAAEIALLRSRNAELESDIASIAGELAAATVARAEATRLQRERDEARERAHIERRLAAEDRLRAAEAALRATELQARLREAEHRIQMVMDERRGSAATVSGEGDADRGPSLDPQPIDSNATSEEPPVVIVDDAITEEGAPEPEPPVGPLWSASEPAASVATTADPWTASTQPSMGGSTAPSLSEADRGRSKEPDVVDLTSQEDDAETPEEPSE